MRRILFVLLCSLLTAQVFGYSFKDDDSGLCFNITRDWEQPYTVEVTCENSDNYYAINYIRLTTAIIPETVSYSGETYTVTSIGSYAFYGCSGLTSVNIPNSVMSIGSYAFSGCNGLTSVNIPNSVTSIGQSAFSGCNGLTSVTIPNSVMSISESAFSGCSNLTSVTIPNSVTSIGSQAFYNCSGLTSVTIPNSVTSIGQSAFSGCNGLTSVTIPNSVMSISESAFSGCSGLTSINVENGNEFYSSDNGVLYNIGKTKFIFCPNGKKGDMVIPNSVTSIGSQAFYNCSGLTSVIIPNSVTKIGSNAFYNCSGLTSVTIPNSVTSIGSQAFYNCSGLASVNFAEDSRLTSIGYDAFYGCSGLNSLTIPNSVTSIGSNAFSGVNTIIYGGSATDEGSWSSNWGAGKRYYVDENFAYSNTEKTIITEYLGQGTEVVIPNGVTEIGSSVFQNCTNLTSVSIPNSVTSIGDYAFYRCSGLTSVIIPNSVTSIGWHTFDGCSGLTSVVIPESVTSIEDYAFSGCSGLTSVTIPNSVTEIGYSAFYGVTTIIYNGTATGANWGAYNRYYVADENFAYSNTEKTIITEYIGHSSEVVIPNGVTEIGSSAFQNCTNLTSVTIPNSVTSIGQIAFSGCSGLTSVDIPNSVTYIGPNAFYKVKNINYNGSATGSPWGANAINGVAYEYPINDDFLTDNYGILEETNDGIILIVPSDCSNQWDAQLITPSWRGLEGQVEGASFCLSFDYKGTADGGNFRIASGKTYPFDANYTQDGNTQIVNDLYIPVVWAENQSITTDWQHYDYDYYIGAEGADSIRLEIDCGQAGGDVYFKNFVLKIDGKVVAEYYRPETLKKNNVTYILNEDGTATVGSSNVSGAVTIDGTVSKNGKTYTVTAISTNAFKDCSGITSVTIPNSVTSIGSYAFYGCSGLNSLTIPNSVTSIGSNAFSSINIIIYGGSATDEGSWSSNWGAGKRYYAVDENFAYSNTEKTIITEYIGHSSEVVIPNGVTEIGYDAFSNCTNLTSVTFPNSVTHISGFYGCTGLTSVTFPNSVTYIEGFYGCTNLTSVTFPNSVTSINGFNGCTDLTSVTFPNSVTYIGGFDDCTNLTSVTFSNSVTSIYGFDDCTNLISVTFPNSVTDIGGFNDCTSLTSVVIGNSVAIMRNTFTGCSNITNITCNSLMPPVADDAFVFSYEFYKQVTLTYPGEAYNLYSKMEPWCFFNVDTNAQGERVLYINRNDTVTYLDTVFVFNNDTIYSITHDTIVVANQSITHDTTYVVSKDTVYVIGSTAKTYKVTSTTTNSVMGIGIGTGMYEENSQVELVAIANYGYHFTKWSDGNTNNPRFEKVTADCNYYAEFGVNNYSVMASSNNIKMGYVEGSDDYAYLSKTQLRAVPKYGYKFTGWSDGETVNPREVLVYCDTTFTALFMANDETDIDGETANGVVVYAHHNVIVVENATADIYVYDTMGRLVARKGVCEGSAQIAMPHEGIYIVKCGGDVKRIYLGFRN